MTILLTHLKGKTQMNERYTKIAVSMGGTLKSTDDAMFKIGVLVSIIELSADFKNTDKSFKEDDFISKALTTSGLGIDAIITLDLLLKQMRLNDFFKSSIEFYKSNYKTGFLTSKPLKRKILHFYHDQKKVIKI
jgi:hypothetical protein